jgi:hypothetical protein
MKFIKGTCNKKWGYEEFLHTDCLPDTTYMLGISLEMQGNETSAYESGLMFQEKEGR